MPRPTERIAVLRPLGLVAADPVPPAREMLLAGFAIGSHIARASLPPPRKRLTPDALARALPKGAATRGDLLVRLATGDVYVRLARKRDSLIEAGSVLAWLGWPDPGPGDIDAEAHLALPSPVCAPGAFRSLVPTAGRQRYDRAGLVDLAVFAIDECGRRRCNDQSVRLIPGDLVTLTVSGHDQAA